MAQHDYNIADQTGLSFLSDINLLTAAIVSNNSGATEPTATFAYMFWADTTANILKQRNAADSAWISLLALPTGIAVQSATVTDNAITLAKMAHGTDGELITYDAAGAPANVATGTSTHVLTSNGTGAAPTFQAPAGGGKVVQVVNTQTGAVATGTTTTPWDDTIPQNTEGNEFMTLAITPTSATSRLRIEVEAQWSPTATGRITAAIHQDTTAGALASMWQYSPGSGQADVLQVVHNMVAGTTSATTFKVRMGLNVSGTVTFNGSSGSRYDGGVTASSITITEYSV